MKLAGRMRVTLSGPVDAVFELDPTEARESDGDGRHVITAAPTSADVAREWRRFGVSVDGWWFEANVERAARAATRDRTLRAAAAHHAAAGLVLRAQIPGRVVRVWVAEGDEVEQGQRLLAVEAMKMENEIRAPHAGRVSGLRVKSGALVERGDELLAIS